MDLGERKGHEQAKTLSSAPGTPSRCCCCRPRRWSSCLCATWFFLLDRVAELDLTAIDDFYEARDPRGVKFSEPRMMVLLLLTSVDPLVMPGRNLPTHTAADPPGQCPAQLHGPRAATSARVGTAGSRATTARRQSIATNKSSWRSA